MKKKFRRHFRIYLVNGHPAYIVDEEGDLYVFHRVTHSKTSGGRKTWTKQNPLKQGGKIMHIVKREEMDKKGRFSLFELELRPKTNISYPEIKRAGGSQTKHDMVKVVNIISTSKTIKPKRRKKCKKKG